MQNLLQETKEAIAASRHSPKDIIFIGSQQSGHQCSWAEFCLLANFEYDAGYGSQEVAPDLIIVFSDTGCLRRREYDGSEWWEYTYPFVLPAESKPIVKLTGSWASTLEELNK